MPYGFHGGVDVARRYPVTTDSAINEGDMLKLSRQTVNGVSNVACVTPCSAGDNPVAVAAESVAKPTAHGALDCLCYNSPEAVFEYPPDTGTVDGSLVFKTCDTGGAQSINIDASADDVIKIVDVDTYRNTVLVKVAFEGEYVGVA
jgi:hypothetical protein